MVRYSPRTNRVRRPGVVVIGASTGGPQALVELLSALGDVPERVPVCVTLHMPPDLMGLVAGNVARQCCLATRVVEASCPLQVGVVYFTPGDRHLCFARSVDGVVLSLAAAPSRAHCKPAVDRMFSEAARVFGGRTLGVVLSGMGEDGLAGAHAIVAAGGTLLVQDKASSAVWGMPGAVAKAGLAERIASPGGIAQEVLRRFDLAGVLA